MKTLLISRNDIAPTLVVIKYSWSHSVFFSVKSKVKPPVVMSGAPRNLTTRPTVANRIKKLNIHKIQFACRWSKNTRRSDEVRRKIAYQRNNRKLDRETDEHNWHSCRWQRSGRKSRHSDRPRERILDATKVAVSLEISRRILLYLRGM